MIAYVSPSVYGGVQQQLMKPECGPIECAPELQQSLAQIQKLPAARELIAKVQKEGPFRIQVNRSISGQFGAFWDPDQRVIHVTLSPDRVEGSLIGSILFELHNAIASSKLDYYDSLAAARKISKDKYVEAVERMEYQNSLSTAKLAEQGVAMGIFPKGARMPTYASFEEHFRIQKMGGHSQWIANNYDSLLMTPHFMVGPAG
jgi:hypothetical protein